MRLQQGTVSVAIIMLTIMLTLCVMIATELGIKLSFSGPGKTLSATAAQPTEEVPVEEVAQEIPEEVPAPTPPELPSVTPSSFVRIKDSCGPYFDGECVRVRSGPGLDYPVISNVRNDMVLKTSEKIEVDGVVWYKIVFDEWIRYRERLKGDWYIAGQFIEEIPLADIEASEAVRNPEQKKIIVDRSEQMLYAYEGEELFMKATTSTGLELTPTPRGTFTIFQKVPSRYMQGPLPNVPASRYYDLPGVPWNLYFTSGGAVIHGAYWHTSFGSPYSHGCVNLPPAIAKELYIWASIGTTVVVRD